VSDLAVRYDFRRPGPESRRLVVTMATCARDDDRVRRLKFYPDYRADPVWDAKDGCMVNLDGLPVGSETRVSLRAWAERWEALAWQRMSAEDGEAGASNEPAEPVADEQWREVERDGRQLCAQLQLELGDDWIVEWSGI
jgi:hypothetical protein